MPFRNNTYTNVEEELREREEQLRFVLEGSELGYWDWNIATQTVKRNERWATMLGYTYEEIESTTQQWSDFIHPDDRERAWASIMAVLQGESDAHHIEYRMLTKQGHIVWILDRAKVMKRDSAGKPTRMCGTHSDITERKKLEMELLKQAHVDYLTGINNRRYFMELAAIELNRSKHHDHPLSLLMIDVDHFKHINDKYGHLMGDVVLQQLVTMFQKNIRSEDIIGRLGGEEFAILLPETTTEAAYIIAERLRESISNTLIQDIAQPIVNVTISIGLSKFDQAMNDIDGLIKCADHALYSSKHLGRNRVSIWTDDLD